MARYQVILAYDGTLFEGFQRQAHARTVQSVFEDALRRIGWQDEVILSAGRTDTGVHASGQVVAFDLDWAHSPQELCAALNANLPPDVAAQDVRLADGTFHPRYDAIARTYRYRIFCQIRRNPLRERYAWRIFAPLDVQLLQQAADLLHGTHDFAPFGTPPRTGGSTIRAVTQAFWQTVEDEMVFTITANAFLYHMVRRLVFVQVLVGHGKLTLEQLVEGWVLPSPIAPGLAAPQGLTLAQVDYPTVEGLRYKPKDFAEGIKHTLAASGENDRGQDFRP
ncbi:MAG: tRNA pseudouridine(38-40) synthase TruA [Anaerolineaceae bacterium]